MLGNFFRKSMDRKQRVSDKRFLARVNENQTAAIHSPTSSGGEEEYIKHISFPWSTLVAVLLIFNISFFFC
jgi:hypothetical protein